MTQAAIGGPAQTTYRVTSRQGVSGRDAQRVFVVSDGRPQEGGPQQAVYYVSDAEIAAGDFVISGNKPIPIVEVGAARAEYPPIAVYVVTVDSESDFPPQADPTPPPSGPVLLLDLEADTLVLSDGDPVSTWADQSGNGRDFTQTGTARPTYHVSGGVKSVDFDGVGNWLLGPVFADNLDSFTVFMAINRGPSGSSYAPVICKLADVNTDTGWAIQQGGMSFFCSMNGFIDFTSAFNVTQHFFNIFDVITAEMISRTNIVVYYNGDSSDSSVVVTGTLTNYGNSEPVRIGMEGDNGIADGFLKAKLQAVRVYAPAPDSTQRAAIEAELAARYGITL